MGLLKQSLRNGKGYHKIICETYKLWPGLLPRPFFYLVILIVFLAFTPGKAFFVYFFRKATCAENLHYEQAPLPEISFRPLKLKRCAELDEAARLRLGLSD